MKGIINLNKPSGISSAAAVSKVRRILGTKSAGHMGTLDPLASGVLLIGIGKACRLFDFYLKKDKKYTAIFDFGTETDTLDCTGIITISDSPIPSLQQIDEVLPDFMGKIQQIPPQYSAKSVDGQRAYKVARQGGTLDLKPSEVEIFDIKVTKQLTNSSFEFDIHCSAGTYIRSLARDIAAKLATHAIMTSLIRTTCGSFCLENSLTLEQLECQNQSALVSVEDALKTLPTIELDDNYHKLLLNGIKLKLSECTYKIIAKENNQSICTDKVTTKEKEILTSDSSFLLKCGGELFGIAKTNEEGIIKISSYLRD